MSKLELMIVFDAEGLARECEYARDRIEEILPKASEEQKEKLYDVLANTLIQHLDVKVK